MTDHPTIVAPDGHIATQGPSWLRTQMTVPNVLLVATVLIGIGGYVTSVKTLEQRVEQLESRLDRSQSDDANTYQRRDVLDPTLRSIEQRLGNIEGAVKELTSRR